MGRGQTSAEDPPKNPSLISSLPLSIGGLPRARLVLPKYSRDDTIALFARFLTREGFTYTASMLGREVRARGGSEPGLDMLPESELDDYLAFCLMALEEEALVKEGADELTLSMQDNPRQQVVFTHAENKLDSEESAPAQMCVPQAELAIVSAGPMQEHMEVIQEADVSDTELEKNDAGEAKHVHLDQAQARKSAPRDEAAKVKLSPEPPSMTAQSLCSGDQQPTEHEDAGDLSCDGEEAASEHEQPAQAGHINLMEHILAVDDEESELSDEEDPDSLARTNQPSPASIAAAAAQQESGESQPAGRRASAAATGHTRERTGRDKSTPRGSREYTESGAKAGGRVSERETGPGRSLDTRGAGSGARAGSHIRGGSARPTNAPHQDAFRGAPERDLGRHGQHSERAHHSNPGSKGGSGDGDHIGGAPRGGGGGRRSRWSDAPEAAFAAASAAAAAAASGLAGVVGAGGAASNGARKPPFAERGWDVPVRNINGWRVDTGGQDLGRRRGDSVGGGGERDWEREAGRARERDRASGMHAAWGGAQVGGKYGDIGARHRGGAAGSPPWGKQHHHPGHHSAEGGWEGGRDRGRDRDRAYDDRQQPHPPPLPQPERAPPPPKFSHWDRNQSAAYASGGGGAGPSAPGAHPSYSNVERLPVAALPEGVAGKGAGPDRAVVILAQRQQGDWDMIKEKAFEKDPAFASQVPYSSPHRHAQGGDTPSAPYHPQGEWSQVGGETGDSNVGDGGGQRSASAWETIRSTMMHTSGVSHAQAGTPSASNPVTAVPLGRGAASPEASFQGAQPPRTEQYTGHGSQNLYGRSSPGFPQGSTPHEGDCSSGQTNNHVGATGKAVRTSAPHREVLFQRGHAADCAHDPPRSAKHGVDSAASAPPQEIRAGAHSREDATCTRSSKRQLGSTEPDETAPIDSYKAGDYPPSKAWSHATREHDTDACAQQAAPQRSSQSKKADAGVAASANIGDRKSVKTGEAAHQDTLSGSTNAAGMPDNSACNLSASVEQPGGKGGSGRPGTGPNTTMPAPAKIEPASGSSHSSARQALPQRTPREPVKKLSATPGPGAQRTSHDSKSTPVSAKEAVARTPISPPAMSPPKKRVFGKDAALVRGGPYSASTPSSLTGPNEGQVVSSTGTPTPEGNSVFARLGKELETASGGGAGSKAASAGRTIALGNEDRELTLTFQAPRGAKGVRVLGRSGRGNLRDKQDGAVRTVNTNAGGRGRWQNNKRPRDPDVAIEPVVQTVQWNGAVRGGRSGRGGRNSKRHKQ